MDGAVPERKANMGDPIPRVDARLKVTGAARYPSDVPVADPAYAFLVTSAIARGRIRSLDLGAAKAVPGVLDILTHENAGEIRPLKTFSSGGQAGSSIVPLDSARIWHDGQILAMVVAETYEAAREAGHRIAIAYDAEKPSATFGSAGVETKPVAKVSKAHKDPTFGDAPQAFAASAVKVEADYSTPAQHHNPMELFTTTCLWTDGRLTVHEPSQFVYGMKAGVATQLGIDPADVHVVSPFVGGAFGSKGSLTARTAIVALAARRLRRPVKLVATRDQGFTIATYRAETRHSVKLGAGRDGRIAAYLHEAWELSSRPDDYNVSGTTSTAVMYDYGSIATRVNVVNADRNTPGFMRSPPEVPYMYALESAMDELAAALKMDPVALRRVNDTMKDPATGRPYTSRSLMQCYDAAAQAFGWSKRSPEPGSMRDGDWLIGWGCATATYPTQIGPAAARIALASDGTVRVQIAAHDVGTGAYTVIGQAAANRLGVAPDRVTVELGDSALPPAPVAGGSNTTASATSVVLKACDAVRARLFRSAITSNGGPFAGKPFEALDIRDGHLVAGDVSQRLDDAFRQLGESAIEEYAESFPPSLGPDAVSNLYKGRMSMVGGPKGEKLMFAFGAEFVEVRINARTREVRVPRAVGAFAAGHIMNPRTAHSQLMGGMIWGLSSALHEATEIDERTARYVNDNLADYLLPVNADVQSIDVILVPEEDSEVNPMGVKGLGELGNVGTNAAVANAVYHATGRRIRDLPIRIEKLL
ncbi:xanthine dehydrogenase family protein molybdopterin-binding subunit [Labrys monachus]|uniref:Xanthine dehydrogenase YagR molybdenum-binding subunit n=1 Tax=Labrys monachus TaxID=217067 RepID=A0ABU0FED4_9HYPH|nr:xanthine dehydrogenase family protein molybdopterin-binding subunit [Labrys monachus]MDQ0392966.1 xanthine dehydrogenase YagR molybdenum-binding subunit [Labrys monachus]